MAHAMTDRSWSIASNSGRASIVSRAISPAPAAGKLVCSFEIEGAAWRRSRPLSDASLTRDFRVELSQVVVRIDLLEALRLRLVEWQVNPSDFVCSFVTLTKGISSSSCRSGAMRS